MDSRARTIPLALLVLAGCVENDPPPATVTDAGPTAAVTPSQWQRIGDSAQVMVPGEADDPALELALELAIAQARETADDARRRWQALAPADRAGWAIKWAAPTADGGVEFVWVEPLEWSPFRIEGRLASPPRRDLESLSERDDLVSFPAEELVDWVRFSGPDFTGEREGGYTIDALEERFGAATGG